MLLITTLLPISLAANWPSEADWQPLTLSGAPLQDIEGDHYRSTESPGDNSLDIVGDADDPAGFWYADGDDVFFRMRITETPWQDSGQTTLVAGSWLFALDTDGDDAAMEYGLQFSEGGINLMENQAGGEGPEATLVRRTNTADSDLQLSETAAEFGTKNDWFIDVAVSRADLASWFDIGDADPLRIALVSHDAYDAQTHDRDLAGSDDTTALGDLGDVWSDTLYIDADGDGVTDPEEAVLGTDPEDGDSDDDGLSDGEEVELGTLPDACDSDGDGLPDGLEMGRTEPVDGTDGACFIPDADPATQTDPTDPDTDGGGVWDGDEDWNTDGAVDAWEIDPQIGADDVDTDGDGIWDALEELCKLDGGEVDDVDSDGDTLGDADEWLYDVDEDGWPNFCDLDSDGDTLEDIYEGDDDYDGDGIPNYEDTDSDNDGVPDSEELLADEDCDDLQDAYDADNEDGPCGDLDGDGERNDHEEDCGSDPENPDTDGDGIDDGEESCEDDEDCDGTPDRLDDDPTDGPCSEPPDGDGSDDGGIQDTGTFPTPTFSGGHFTGGGCSTVPGLPALLPILLAAMGALRRRRWALAAAAGAVGATVPTAARAQEAAQSLNAQSFTSALDGQRFLGMDDSAVGPTWGMGGGLLFNYANDPFVYRYDDEDLGEFGILESVGTADAAFFVNLPRVRVGGILPLHLVSSGYQVDGFRLLGDARLEATGEIIERGAEGFGLGLNAGATVPTGNEESWLGDAGATFDGGLIASVGVGPVVALASAGFQTGSGQILDDVVWGNRVSWGVGGSYAVTDALYVSAELQGDRILKSSTAPGASPAEALLGLHANAWEHLVVHVGGGAGITSGIGAPDWRALAGVSWNPRAPQAKLNDRDGDGISDEVDNCPDQPEDRNGVDDEDGCPDGNLTPTRIQVLDAAGRQIAGVGLEMTSGPETGSYTLTDGELVRSLPPGAYKARVAADGYAPASVTREVPEGGRHEQVVRLDPIGEFRIRVTHADGSPIEGARVVLIGSDEDPIAGQPDGSVSLVLPEGEYRMLVTADGYRPRRETMTITGQEKRTMDMVLSPSRVTITADQVAFDGKIYFEYDKATIKQESFNLLDEIAEALEANPQITRVRVEGHTDSKGRDSYNLELSQERADAVRSYLIDVGIDAGRLQAVGKGETELLIKPDDTDEKRARNRRVEFDIVETK